MHGVVEIINPILRGWVNYFAIGHSSRCFQFVKRWVELKIRRHLMRARKRRGFGWERWSTQWLHATLGLFNGYRIASRSAESTLGCIGPITRGTKQTGERSAGKPHAAFDVAGAGNVAWSKCWDTRNRKGEQQGIQTSTYTGAPVLDPTAFLPSVMTRRGFHGKVTFLLAMQTAGSACLSSVSSASRTKSET